MGKNTKLKNGEIFKVSMVLLKIVAVGDIHGDFDVLLGSLFSGEQLMKKVNG